MRRYIRKRLQRLFRNPGIEIEPDEIFLDSSNLPDFDRNQFEGRIEKPIKKEIVIKLAAVFLLIFMAVVWKTWVLQGISGEAYNIQSEMNRLRHGLIFSERGIVYDRNDVELVWNIPNAEDGFATRSYMEENGFSHILGYITYPLKDSKGIFYQPEYIGIEGVEYQYDHILQGDNGLKIIEANARDEIQSESVIRPPRDGNNITLALDSRLQIKLHEIIADVARSSRFDGGVGIIMNVNNGEILALTNYPEYNSNVLSEGGPVSDIESYLNSTNKPFLNRAISGVYTPGSIVKPFIGIGALNEGVVTPTTEILSTGVLTIPNPFNDELVSSFKDWKAHGYVDLREAIAVSSNIYFYQVGGGYETQEGIGIENIERYVRMFGIGNITNIDLPAEAVGTIPSPSWKEENFPGDIWRIGDTYHTSIGQYGFQVTPIQMVRAIATFSNGGILVEPTVLLNNGKETIEKRIPIDEAHFDVIKEGMRQAVMSGTAVALNFEEVAIAAKSGTAEVGADNEYVNSWTTGYFPYENPEYAFIILMDKAPEGTLTGSVSAAQRLFRFIIENTPEYYGGEPLEENIQE